ncbi:MAG TPA: MOSC N-terminal beta barrel domain-containing protein [Candidatus Binataceae bacterium]|nr:MOSC N-terminal beta barrel domain-containing protein [Candidatus Binataceae bacterium]
MDETTHRKPIGTVSAIWRYPIKSMRGERIEEAQIGERGLAGDRAWALREIATRQIASAKKFSGLFEFRASYDSAPALSSEDEASVAPVTVELPDGRKIHASDDDASEAISAALGRKMQLERVLSAPVERAGIDPATVFAGIPAASLIGKLASPILPDSFALRRGTFFDSAVVHVIAAGTLKHLVKLAPGSNFDPRRFRANILVDTGERDDAFIEDEWLEGTLEVGSDVKIVAMKPALRCVMTTHPQEDLPRDYTILRTAAFHHRANVGVFASIGAGGIVRAGDPVVLVR